MNLLAILNERLCEPVDRRLRTMTYAMTGLLVYFILDSGLTRTASSVAEMKTAMQPVIADMETATALSDRIPAIVQKIALLQNDKMKAEEEYRQWLATAEECNEKLLVDLLNSKNSENAPFNQFRIQEESATESFAHLFYSIDLHGTYPEILQLLQRVDESPCRRNIASWNLTANPKAGDLLSGLLVFEIYKRKENAP